MATPTILDSLNLPKRNISAGTTDSFTYTVPGGGSNKLLIIMGGFQGTTPTVTQNGASVTMAAVAGTFDRVKPYVGYLAAPTTGTLSVTLSGSGYADYVVMTLQDAAQTTPIDVAAVTNNGSSNTKTTSVTTTVGNDLLLSFAASSGGLAISSYGTSETEILNFSDLTGVGPYFGGAQKAAASSSGTESMTTTYTNSGDIDQTVIAVKYAASVSGPANLKTYNTNVKANIKTIDTNVIANVKSLNTNT